MFKWLSASTASAQLVRFIINGLAATVVHFGALWLLMEILLLPTAGGANLLASSVGILVSYLGNRHFVFRGTNAAVLEQATRFVLLYAAIAVVHGSFLFAWTDLAGLDYRIGFFLAMLIQFALSFSGNRRLVFVR